VTDLAHTLAPTHGENDPGQLAQNIDALMQRLNAVQPEDGFPQEPAVASHTHSKNQPPLWNRLKDVARRLAHPVHASESVRGAQVEDAVEEVGHMPASQVQNPAGMDTPTRPQVHMLEQGHPITLEKSLYVNGNPVRVHSGLYSLNDLYYISGAPDTRRPRLFLLKKTALDCVRMLAELNAGPPPVRQVKRRGQGRTGHAWDIWARRELLLAYAGWISPVLLDTVHKALVAIETQQHADNGNNAPPPKDAPLTTPPFNHLSVDIGAHLNGVTMTSGEIAELVESRHEDVRRSIDRLVKRGVIRQPPISFSERINNLGLPQKTRHYIFSGEAGKRDSIVVVAQLSPELTAKLVDRWLQLERHALIGAFGVPQTLQAALRMAADLLDENQALKLENQTLKQLPPSPQPQKTGLAGGEVEDLSEALTVAELASSLGLGRNWLCGFLRDERLLMKSGTTHTPHNRVLQSGFFAYRPTARKRTTSGNAPFMQLVVTTRGQEHIEQRLRTLGLLSEPRAEHIHDSTPFQSSRSAP